MSAIFPHGYCSDLGRTICVGAATQQQKATYQIIWEEHERLIRMLRPGVSCKEIYYSHKRHWEERGWPMERAYIGHGLGVGLKEEPLIAPENETPLVAGMCLCIEPMHLIQGVERYHVEDLVLITENAPRILSRSADWSRLLTPGE